MSVFTYRELHRNTDRCEYLYFFMDSSKEVRIYKYLYFFTESSIALYSSVCRSVLQCVAVCCSVLQYVAAPLLSIALFLSQFSLQLSINPSSSL